MHFIFKKFSDSRCKELDDLRFINPESNEIVEERIENGVDNSYIEQTRFEVKPSLWERIKNMKLVRSIRYVMKIKVVLEFPALPEGNSQQQ